MGCSGSCKSKKESALPGCPRGILSMGIGALSVGMALLGALAERVGAVLALRVFGVAGCALMCLWLTLRPEALRIRQQ